jgi:hypothetical protein
VEVRVAGPVEVSKLQGNLRFRREARDSLLIKGDLDLPPGFLPDGASFRLDAGGATADFLLNGKGRGSLASGAGAAEPGRGRARLKYCRKDGRWGFRVKIRRSQIAEAWADEGVAADTPGDAAVDLRVAVTVADVPFITLGTWTYSRRSGRLGRVR